MIRPLPLLLAAALLAAGPAAAKPAPIPTPEGMVAVDPPASALAVPMKGVFVRLSIGDGGGAQYAMIPDPPAAGQPAAGWLVQVNPPGEGMVFEPIEVDCAASRLREGQAIWMDERGRQAFRKNETPGWGEWLAVGTPRSQVRIFAIACKPIPEPTLLFFGWRHLRSDGSSWLRQAGNPTDAPQAITTPDWVELPGPYDLSRFYPRGAIDANKGARVDMSCLVAASGRVQDCLPISDTAPGYGFSEAAVKMAPKFRMKPMARDGKPVAGGNIILPVIFVPPE